MLNLVFLIMYPLLLSLSITTVVINITPDSLGRRGIVAFTIINYFIILPLHIDKRDTISVATSILSVFLYSYVVSRNICKATVIALCTNIIISTSDAIIGVIEIDMFNIRYSEIIGSPKMYFIAGIFILLISYTISKIIGIIYNKIHDEDSNIKNYFKENLKIISYIVFGLVMLNIYMIMFRSLVKSIGRVTFFLNMVLLVGFISMSVLLIYLSSKNTKNKLKREYKEKEYQQLKEYTDKVETMDSDLRRFKHDYINILQTLGGYIETGDINGLNKFYFTDLLMESNKIIDKDRYLSLLKHIKISALKALISSKVISSYAYGIETKIEISDDIDELSINTIDICRIIGILIDNAIEAAVLCDEKIVQIAIVKTDDSTIFIISNSCLENTPPIYKIYEENFSTKGEGRGIGLKTVRHIINEKYDNVILNTKIKDCIFKQELILHDFKA